MEPMFFFYLTFGAMLFLVLSLLLGHGHAGHGHHGGHGAGHGHSGGHGHAGHGGHARGSGASQQAGSANMSVWSFQMFFLFVSGFGAGGYFAALARLNTVITLLGGVLGGVMLAAVGYFIINIFYRRQSNSAVNSEAFIGLTGIVITSINEGSVGQVRCQIGDNRETFLAKSVDGSAIPSNATVRIANVVGSTAIVEIDDADEQKDLPWRK